MRPKGRIILPSLDERDTGSSAHAEQVLKKGPWTSAEDAILIEYVKKHGEGNWNEVQKNSGLSRCGKSCRLRWSNHLRPYLKKGAFTVEEEQKIVELHSQMGNKWARMAAYLPGRTDNEIKNYWNTRIKRRKRAGLPLYPSNMCIHNSDENHKGSGEFVSYDKQHNDFLPASNHDFSIPMLDLFNVSQGFLSYAAPFCDLSSKNMLHPGFGPKALGFSNPTIHGAKRFHELETSIPGLQGCFATGFQLDTFLDEPPDKIPRTYGGGYAFDHNLGGENLAPVGGVVLGSHALSNGNFSASGPLFGTMKLELPSLQYPETDPISLPSCTSSLHEAVDGCTLSPPATQSMESDCSLPRNSGLLESLFYEAQPFGAGKNQISGKSSTCSAFTPSDMIQSSVSKTELDEYSENVSPICGSTSVFSDFPPSQFVCASGVVALPSAEYLLEPRRDFTGHEALLASSDWVAEDVGTTRDLSSWNDALADFLGGDM